jgi:DNA-binding response OmpR family regulator
MREATILLVEDEPSMLKFVRTVLLESGCYQVLSATSGIEAIRIGMEFAGPIDLLLADVVMPQMLGTDVAAQLKEARPGMRVILMSGYDGEELQVLDAGWRFLKKPFVGRQLLERISAMLEEKVRSASD